MVTVPSRVKEPDSSEPVSENVQSVVCVLAPTCLASLSVKVSGGLPSAGVKVPVTLTATGLTTPLPLASKPVTKRVARLEVGGRT